MTALKGTPEFMGTFSLKCSPQILLNFVNKICSRTTSCFLLISFYLFFQYHPCLCLYFVYIFVGFCFLPFDVLFVLFL